MSSDMLLAREYTLLLSSTREGEGHLVGGTFAAMGIHLFSVGSENSKAGRPLGTQVLKPSKNGHDLINKEAQGEYGRSHITLHVW